MVGLPHGTLQSCGRIYWFNRCSMCCRWQYCCLLDLFMHDDGPALRSKVAHATVHLDAMLDQDTDPHLARLCEVLAVCFVSICATIRMQRIQAHCDGMMRGTYLPDDTTGIRDEIQQCVRKMKDYSPVFHTHALVNRAQIGRASCRERVCKYV